MDRIPNLSVALTVSVINPRTYIVTGKLMPDNKKEAGTETVKFEELSLEGEGETPSRSVQLLALLKENLNPEKLGEAKKILGVQEEISNSELLAEIQKLLAEKKEAPKGEGDGSDYKTFMKTCMGEGKDLKTCSAEYKEKYPTAAEPSTEDLQEIENLVEKKKPEDEYPEPIKKKMEELQAEIESLKALNRNEGIDSRVDALVEGKNLAPRQAVEVKKLMRQLPDVQHASILNIFQSQQMAAHEDVGKVEGGAPAGRNVRNVMTPEEKKAILKSSGLLALMKEKGGKFPGVD